MEADLDHRFERFFAKARELTLDAAEKSSIREKLVRVLESEKRSCNPDSQFL
jgi:hypothetical protein